MNGAGFGLTVEIIHSTNALADLATRKKEHEPRVSDLPGVGEAAYVTTVRRIIEFLKGQTIINLYTESLNNIIDPGPVHRAREGRRGTGPVTSSRLRDNRGRLLAQDFGFCYRRLDGCANDTRRSSHG